MGSSSSGASQAAQQAEDQRRADIQRTQQRIQGIFDSPEREREIGQFIGSTRDFLQSDLNRAHDRNARQLKFSLARSGQAGGSTQIDQGRDLAEAFLSGSAQVERRAQGAGANLRSADQRAKLDLFNQALGGLDLTTAAQNAATAQRTNIGLARNEATEGNFDNFFRNFADIFKQSREAAADRRTSRDLFTLYGSPPPGGGLTIAGGI